MSDHVYESDEVVGDRYIVTCSCGKSYEDRATQEGSDHVHNQMQGHLLGSNSRSGSGDDESLSVYDAAQIWASNGMDEDYTFGYSEGELRDAL